MNEALFVPEELCKKYNLRDWSIEEKEKQFSSNLVTVIKSLSKPRLNNHYRQYIPINTILDGTKLHDFAFMNNNCTYSELFDSAGKQNFELQLFYLSLLLKQGYVQEDYNDDTISQIEQLKRAFSLFNLPYTYNKKGNRFARKIDKLTERTIKENLVLIKQNENNDNAKKYNECVSDFLFITSKSTQADYTDSLSRLENVFERTLDNKWPKTKISDKDLVLGKLLKSNGGDINTISNSISFIIKNIHHNQKDKAGKTTPYKFSKNEYIYWWMEINKLIYLVNQN